jgi:anti-sigma-K factor RskA
MSEDFDAILDRCLADIAAGRETIDSCLRRYPAQASRLAVLLELAGQMQTAPSLPLPADKRRTLETQLLKRAAQMRSRPTAGQSTTPRLPLWRRSLLPAFAAIVVVVLILGSTVSASAASVPVDVLYPVKRATEQVRLALTSYEQQTEAHLEFAQQRLRELNVLQERGEVSEELLAEISTETTLILDRISTLPQDRQQMVLASLTDFQDQHQKVLAVMASSARGEAQTNVLNALADSEAKRQRVKDLLDGGSDVSPVQVASPEPTIPHKTQPTEGKPKPKATTEAKKLPPATPHKPTPKVEHTPPGQDKPPTSIAPPDKATKELKPTKEPVSQAPVPL